MEESNVKYKKEGLWGNVNGLRLMESMGRKPVAGFIESQEAMIMQLVKMLGGRVVLPWVEDRSDLNLEMRVNQLEDGSCEVVVRDKQPVS